MVATDGFAELLTKKDVVRICKDEDELAVALCTLRQTGFKDNAESLRWMASSQHTWECRAAAMLQAFSSLRESAAPSK